MFSVYKITASIKSLTQKQLEDKSLDLLFYIILISSFIIRVIDLNYNSAFNDEAIYIVIGRMGLFASDWWTYGANLWMAGLPYIYPPLSALAYQAGGLLGSRLLNVIFGTILIEEVYRFTRLIHLFDKKTNQIAAIAASFIVGFSGIGIFVSKLATYDMASFLLMMMGINTFLRAKFFSNGKYYFLTFLFLLGAFFTKIVIAVFFPFLFIISIVLLRKRSIRHGRLAVIYLFAPFTIGMFLYFFLHLSNLITFVFTHKNLGTVDDYQSIINLIWSVAKYSLVASVPATVLLFRLKKTKEVLTLLILASLIPVFHISLHRYATLNKHMYLSIVFLSVIIGYGVSALLQNKKRVVKFFAGAFLPLTIFFYVLASYSTLNQLEHEWEDTRVVESFLQKQISPGDKVLTEDGAAIILALYDKVFPPLSVFTFDWIDYSGLKGDAGYIQAMNDSYFNYIELNRDFEGKDALRNRVRDKLTDSYSLIFSEDNFEVYKKND